MIDMHNFKKKGKNTILFLDECLSYLPDKKINSFSKTKDFEFYEDVVQKLNASKYVTEKEIIDVIKMLDDLLVDLPQKTIDLFSNSPYFEFYKSVLDGFDKENHTFNNLKRKYISKKFVAVCVTIAIIFSTFGIIFFGDIDNDGLSGFKEISIGTSMFSKSTDSDSLSDKQEIDIGTDPLNHDSDYDGHDDYEEAYTYQTDPLDSNYKNEVEIFSGAIISNSDFTYERLLDMISLGDGSSNEVVKEIIDEYLNYHIYLVLSNDTFYLVFSEEKTEYKTVTVKGNVRLNITSSDIGLKVVEASDIIYYEPQIVTLDELRLNRFDYAGECIKIQNERLLQGSFSATLYNLPVALPITVGMVSNGEPLNYSVESMKNQLNMTNLLNSSINLNKLPLPYLNLGEKDYWFDATGNLTALVAGSKFISKYLGEYNYTERLEELKEELEAYEQELRGLPNPDAYNYVKKIECKEYDKDYLDLVDNVIIYAQDDCGWTDSQNDMKVIVNEGSDFNNIADYLSDKYFTCNEYPMYDAGGYWYINTDISPMYVSYEDWEDGVTIELKSLWGQEIWGKTFDPTDWDELKSSQKGSACEPTWKKVDEWNVPKILDGDEAEINIQFFVNNILPFTFTVEGENGFLIADGTEFTPELGLNNYTWNSKNGKDEDDIDWKETIKHILDGKIIWKTPDELWDWHTVNSKLRVEIIDNNGWSYTEDMVPKKDPILNNPEMVHPGRTLWDSGLSENWASWMKDSNSDWVFPEEKDFSDWWNNITIDISNWFDEHNAEMPEWSEKINKLSSSITNKNSSIADVLDLSKGIVLYKIDDELNSNEISLSDLSKHKNEVVSFISTDYVKSKDLTANIPIGPIVLTIKANIAAHLIYDSDNMCISFGMGFSSYEPSSEKCKFTGRVVGIGDAVCLIVYKKEPKEDIDFQMPEKLEEWINSFVFNKDFLIMDYISGEIPNIEFSQDDDQDTLAVTSVSPSYISWCDISVMGSCNTAELGTIVSVGDVIKDCSGAIAIKYAPTNEILGNWTFTEITEIEITPEITFFQDDQEDTLTVTYVDLYHACDINMDWKIDNNDTDLISSHYGETGEPGWIREDVNDDGEINYLDVSSIVNNYASFYDSYDWNDIKKLSSVCNLPSGDIDVGDIITRCKGTVKLKWNPTNEILGSWEFSEENSPPNEPTEEDPDNQGKWINPEIGSIGCRVSDPDEDKLDVSFYWADGNLIGIQNGVISGSKISIYVSKLNRYKTIEWYVVVSDGVNQIQGPTWSFTVEAYDWDINRDACVDNNDTDLISSHYGETGEPGWIREDVNDDGQVNYLDVSIVSSHYGEKY